ncbi:MAG: hypothetical protein IPP51_18195 [Bacteroidetes bacterium]|nr:hypothetical protein [Bacteroidota bacterium]
MKKSILLLMLVSLSALTFGQDAKYMAAMEKLVGALDTTTEEAGMVKLNNGFERIAGANPKEWLPLYYQSYCNIMIGMRQADNMKKDEYYDKAESLINKADSLSPDNSEIYVVKSFVTSMKISVDPATRGQKLGMQSAALNGKAIQLNPENPRAVFLRGSGLMYTPAQWGGGIDKAIPVLEDALVKFKSAKYENKIVPHWGEETAKQMLDQCHKQTPETK